MKPKQGELQIGMENGLAQLQNAPNRGGLIAGGQVGAAGDGPGGDIFHYPLGKSKQTN